MGTNNWSCTLDAFAAAIGVPSSDLISQVGHDGYKIGFNTQELIDVMLSRQFAVTEIQRGPLAINPETLKAREISFGSETAEDRFVRHMRCSNGVLTGYNQLNKTHAVAWLKNHIHDLSTGVVYNCSRINSGLSLEEVLFDVPFTPTKLLKISKII